MNLSAPVVARLGSLVATLVAVLAMSTAGAVTLGPSTVPARLDVQPRVALPSRDDALLIDWVDVDKARLAVGGVTYLLKGAQPRIFLANGDEVATIGYLKPGMRVRIESGVDGTGVQRLVAIHVEP